MIKEIVTFICYASIAVLAIKDIATFNATKKRKKAAIKKLGAAFIGYMFLELMALDYGIIVGLVSLGLAFVIYQFTGPLLASMDITPPGEEAEQEPEAKSETEDQADNA